MPFNAKKIIILSLFNYFVKKYIKDFDFKVLNNPNYDESLYVCQSCTRIMDARSFINFKSITHCIFCKHEFVDLDSHILDNNMYDNNSKILSI